MSLFLRGSIPLNGVTVMNGHLLLAAIWCVINGCECTPGHTLLFIQINPFNVLFSFARLIVIDDNEAPVPLSTSQWYLSRTLCKPDGTRLYNPSNKGAPLPQRDHKQDICVKFCFSLYTDNRSKHISNTRSIVSDNSGTTGCFSTGPGLRLHG
jgi:hypothetical protein